MVLMLWFLKVCCIVYCTFYEHLFNKLNHWRWYRVHAPLRKPRQHIKNASHVKGGDVCYLPAIQKTMEAVR